MAIFRGMLAKHLVPGYMRVVFDSYKERAIEGSKLTNRKTSKRAYEEDFPVAGFGTLRLKPEGTSVNYEDIQEGVVKRYTWSTYALGYRVTREMKRDDLYGTVGTKLSRALGRSARNNAEVVMHAPYNNAFSTSYVGWEAGVALCSTSHVILKTGATVANKPATDADIALPTLQAALEHFHGLVDQTGFPTVYIPRLVVHSIGDYWTVNQLLKSTGLPGGNQNDINQLAKEGLSPHLSHYLTDADAWFVLADNHDVNYYVREPFTFAGSDDFHSGDSLFRGLQAHASGFSDWRGVYGSSGG